MMPDLNSADQPQQPAPSEAPTCRTGRLRHRVGLAAAVVAGASSIALGAGVAQAAPAAAHPGLVVADDPAQSDEDDATPVDDTPSQDDGQAADDSTDNGADDSRTADDSSDATATADAGYVSDDSADSDDQDSTDTAPAAGSGLRQGWDGSVYWFRNSSGEWRYTAHRDVYLERIGSGSSGGSGGDSAGGGSLATATAERGDVETAVQFALAQVGKPFVMGGNGPDSYDCSGLIQQSFRHAGISLPRVANDQYEATSPVGADQLRRGDLLFWSYDGSARGIHHAAIYLGNNKYVEAAHPGTTIRISTLNRGYWPTQMGRP
ncbi:C40 family peptidase [Kitasatospora sp. NPDC058965]|uniref:C40 family peptidase n=1 Tax=Kitasatospora sp. NPDC058965 TaxID=3346682 RepID=UPI0036C4C97B